MTPKEKAEELLSKYYFQVQTLAQQKQSALIALDMMIEYLEYKWDTVGFAEYRIDMNKYIEIKEEILKL